MESQTLLHRNRSLDLENAKTTLPAVKEMRGGWSRNHDQSQPITGHTHQTRFGAIVTHCTSLTTPYMLKLE